MLKAPLNRSQPLINTKMLRVTVPMFSLEICFLCDTDQDFQVSLVCIRTNQCCVVSVLDASIIIII